MIQKAFHPDKTGVLVLIIISSLFFLRKNIFSNIFLSSYILKYFYKNTTIGNSCDKWGYIYITVLISGIYSAIIFLEHQMSKDKPTPLLAIRNLLF